MPLPQSRIGRVVLLGIVLGILVVFAAAAFASVAHAQEAPLPESPDSGAVGPPVGESADKASVGPVIDSPGQRNAEDVACRTAEALLNLYPFHFERDWKNSWLKSLNSTVRELGTYCGTKDELHSDDARTRMSWILGVRSYDFHLMRRLVEATGKPQSVMSRKKLTKFEDVIAELHFDSDALLRWEMFRLTKPRIAEVPKEVIRTVEVPVQIPCPRCPDLVCPSVPECPQGPNPFEVAEERRREREVECDRILKSAVRDWQNHLNTNYPWAKDEYGSALYAAGDINGQIATCNNNGCRDLQSSVVGWERALGSMIEASGRGPGGMAPQVLQRVISLRSMMAAKLESCRGGGRR